MSDKAPRPVLKRLTPAEHLKLGTGPLAKMACKDCGRTGCLIPVPHTRAA